MGYTHYFKLKRPALESDVRKMKKIAEVVCEEPLFGQFVQHPQDATYPGMVLDETDEGKLAFVLNGYCSEKEDLGHESLAVIEGDSRGFCKTARKPYDLTVVAVLAAWQKLGYLKSTDSDSGIEDFAANYEAIIRYSVEECISCFADDETVRRLYWLPTAEQAIEDFEKVLQRLEQLDLRQSTPVAWPDAWPIAGSNWF